MLVNFSPHPFKSKSRLFKHAGTWEPKLRAILNSEANVIFWLMSLLLYKLLNKINVAAASAEPPPNPAPMGIFFSKITLNFWSQFVCNLKALIAFEIKLSLGLTKRNLFFEVW